ncbi:hypothetical protein [Actinomadura sp. 7K507]|uniref:hypothetical protein n=1 Tax=Actinomadura sp. 7K507 TaxID=2530365 RepID=UPI0014048429|nr:hypothetical protein [Actinomadura sp. 7K507]
MTESGEGVGAALTVAPAASPAPGRQAAAQGPASQAPGPLAAVIVPFERLQWALLACGG